MIDKCLHFPAAEHKVYRKRAHSRLYHAELDRCDGLGMAPLEAKRRACEAAASGVQRWFKALGE